MYIDWNAIGRQSFNTSHLIYRCFDPTSVTLIDEVTKWPINIIFFPSFFNNGI